MAAITQEALAAKFKAALDFEADKVVNPAEARQRIANELAEGVAMFVQGRTTIVTGVQTGPGTVNGIIQ